MGKKKKKLKPFARRLTRWIVLSQFVVMGLASYVIYKMAKNITMMEEADLYKSYLNTTNANVSRMLLEVSLSTANHVSEIEENLGQPEKMFSLMEKLVTENSRIRSCGISFVAGYYPQKGRRFCPYAVRDSAGTVVVYDDADASHDYLKAQWFTEALKAKEGYWSKPFFASVDSVPLVSYLQPIRDKQGRTVAIVGADLSLDWFNGTRIEGKQHDGQSYNVYVNTDLTITDGDSLKESSLGWMDRKWRFVSSNFIIDGDGTYIAHPNIDFVLKENYFNLAKATADTIDDHVGRQMIAGVKGFYGDNDMPLPFDFFDLDGISAYVFYEPVEHTNWSVALVVLRLMIDAIGAGVGVAMLMLIALGLLVTRIVGRFIIRRATRPLNKLAESANEVAKGNFSTPLPNIKHNDEIRLLRDSFEGMQHSLAQYMEELKDTTASKAAIENELKIAHDIQMSMLPKTFPPFPERDDIDIYGSLTPAKDVGGDLFDFYIRDNMLFFCIGDVSGKGVPASLVMAVARSLFRNVSDHLSEPDLIVGSLNRAINEGNESCMFVTLFIGRLDLCTGSLCYCNAAHNPPLMIGKDGCKELDCDSNVPVGLMEDWQYTKQQTVLEQGSTIFLYTDGLNEAENIYQDQFKLERVIQVASGLLAEGNTQSEHIVTQMLESVHAFVGEAEQSDDLTMLAIRYI